MDIIWPGPANPFGLFRKLIVELNNDEICALPTTPIAILPAQGPSRALFFPALITTGLFTVEFKWAANFASVDSAAELVFTLGANGPNCSWGGAGTPGTLEEFLTWGGNVIWYPEPLVGAPGVSMNDVTEIFDQPLYVSIDNQGAGVLTGNALNKIRITLFYLVIDR